MKTQDKLDKLFELQENLQKKLNNDITTQNFKTIMTLATIDELMEAIRETPWKPWKKQQKLNTEKFKEELIDAWHFMINLTLSSGMTSEEMFNRFAYKNQINHKRNENGY